MGLLPEIIRGFTKELPRPPEAKLISQGFLKFLRQSRNLKFLPRIIGELKKEIPKKAVVTTSHPLIHGKRREIAQVLSADFGGKLEFSFLVAPQILGGVIVKVEDFVCDGSLKTKLTKLKEAVV